MVNRAGVALTVAKSAFVRTKALDVLQCKPVHRLHRVVVMIMVMMVMVVVVVTMMIHLHLTHMMSLLDQAIHPGSHLGALDDDGRAGKRRRVGQGCKAEC